MNRCIVGLGSNMGSRSSHLRRAFRELAALPHTRLLRRSGFHETEPSGGPSQGRYLNAAALLRTRLTPMGLLVELKRLEYLHGRRPGVRWGPRPLDCDLLFYGDLRIRSRWLCVPHPRALRRSFVRTPLAEILPHPLSSENDKIAL